MLIYIMTKLEISSPKDFKKYLGKKIGYSKWVKVTQERIDAFAAATDDYQWIHTDTIKAKKSDLKTTIAHGYYTLSLLPKFVEEIWFCNNLKLILNYGSEKIRFISPVKCNDQIRGVITIFDAKDYKGGILLTSKVEVEIKNSNKLAMSAETLSLLYPN